MRSDGRSDASGGPDRSGFAALIAAGYRGSGEHPGTDLVGK
jgi:hypothetical protein